MQVHEWHAASEFLVRSYNGINEDATFTVRHFAGDCQYQVDAFMWKNTETLDSQTTPPL